MIKSENLFMICLTESHLNPMISNSEIQIKDWDIIRSDRIGRLGGGVICYLRKDLTPTYIKSFCNKFCEFTAIYIPEVNLACITIYRPPKCPLNKFKEAVSLIYEWLNKLESDNINPKIILNGDLNMPFMNDWNEERITDLLDYVLC